jgi:hypothetical protein
MISARLRLPRTAYLAAGALAVFATPMVQAPWLAIVYLLPIGAFAYIARSGTDVDADGITARAMVGSARVPWSDVVGLRVSNRGQVFALLPGDEQLRLPGARPKDIAVITAVSEAAAVPQPETKRQPETAPQTQPESQPDAGSARA